MNKFILLALLSLTLISCEKQERVNNPPQNVEENDNTGQNVRDRNSAALTPFDQSEKEGDLLITKKIRQIIINDDALSNNAKNIKIITINGVVTLRGPVANSAEKENIAGKIKEVQGIKRVDNQLDVQKNTQ